jgi:hypothetical protein
MIHVKVKFINTVPLIEYYISDIIFDFKIQDYEIYSHIQSALKIVFGSDIKFEILSIKHIKSITYES